MADSNGTKKALAAALKDLMDQVPFEKIRICDLCDRCHMNRKSFYYHFRDKYDLLNWIFDAEFLVPFQQQHPLTDWAALEALTAYLYENRRFYRNALGFSGQNSFAEHLRELLPEITLQLAEHIPASRILDFQSQFFTDTVILAVQHWICDPEPIHPVEFAEQNKISAQILGSRLQELSRQEE